MDGSKLRRQQWRHHWLHRQHLAIGRHAIRQRIHAADNIYRPHAINELQLYDCGIDGGGTWRVKRECSGTHTRCWFVYQNRLGIRSCYMITLQPRRRQQHRRTLLCKRAQSLSTGFFRRRPTASSSTTKCMWRQICPRSPRTSRAASTSFWSPASCQTHPTPSPSRHIPRWAAPRVSARAF